MIRLTLVALTAVLAAGCSSSPSKDLGCLTSLGSAEGAFNATAAGIKDGTTTTDDDAKAMEKVKSNLDELATVTPDAEIKAKATDGALRAGRIRVALLGGGHSAVDVGDVTALHDDINSLDAACVAAGK